MEKVLEVLNLKTTAAAEGVRPAVGLGTLASSYSLSFDSFPAPHDGGAGGAISAVGPHLFLLTRLGQFNVFDEASDRFRKLPIDPPADVSKLETMFERPIQSSSMGYRDLLTVEKDDEIEFTISYLDKDVVIENCIDLVVSRILIPEFEPKEVKKTDWTEIYRSPACIPANKGFFLQSGGAISYGTDGNLYVFVGDFGLDGFNRSLEGFGPQSSTAHVGKVLAISPDSQVKVVSKGHRNPGGIIFSDKEGLILAEHGPRGGDELNSIQDGFDYGWPSETFGSQYGELEWPADETPGLHDRFALPIYAWVPSIAVSALAELRGSEFPVWEGDLILATLSGKSLRRLRLHDGRVVVDERIPVGARIRDLTISETGQIFLLLDSTPKVVKISNANASIGDVPRGLAQCVGCHQIDPNDISEYVGPTLVGVIGREIGTAEGFEYSQALMNLKGKWDETALKNFLMDTQGIAPGSSMPQLDIGATDIRFTLEGLAAISQPN